MEKYHFEMLHLDVMDLNFVPNLTLGFDMINKINSSIPKDIHLMVKDVPLAVERLQTKPTDYITFHIESGVDIQKTIELVKQKAKVGLAISPDTPVESLYPYVNKIDLILIMSVYPGFAGQKFIEKSYERLKTLMMKLKEQGRDMIVGVDGGIGFEQITKFNAIGVNMFVLGTSTLYKGDLEQNILKFEEFISLLR
jgi:ribulose-phosphate 3-epimerase